MRILLASAPVINREIDFNLQTLLEYMKAYRGKVELIVFGESILQGFECLCCLRKQPPHFAAAVYLSLFSVHVSRET